MSAKWRGSKGLRERPALSIEETLEKTSKEVEYEGPYDLCLAHRPKPGDIEAGTGMRVCSVVLKRVPGDRGLLTLKLENSLSTGDTPPPSGQTVELDWIETEKDLLTHPRYAGQGIYPGEKHLVPSDLVKLRNWKDEPNAQLREWYLYRIDLNRPLPILTTKSAALSNGNVGELSDNAKDYADKIIRGQETYRIYLPVVKRTTKISNPIAGSACGKKLSGLPSGLPQPIGYQWMKTADRSIRSGAGKWERSEEWGGYAFIDGDLY